MRQQCIDEQTPPDLHIGDTLDAGVFLRNLKKKDVSKRYEDDNDDLPKYGWKLNTRFWRDLDNQQGNFSVNLQDCIHSDACSIAIHPVNDGYYHVAAIDLEKLNQSESLSTQFLAQYKPIEKDSNRCHFELVPLNGTATKWMEFGFVIDSPFPDGKKPNTDADRAEAEAECDRFRALFDIHRWVRSRDKKLLQ